MSKLFQNICCSFKIKDEMFKTDYNTRHTNNPQWDHKVQIIPNVKESDEITFTLHENTEFVASKKVPVSALE